MIHNDWVEVENQRMFTLESFQAAGSFMLLPAIRGILVRRILANYQIDPACISEVLPAPFRPKVVDGYAIGGIRLIRLQRVRPKLFPIPSGLSSENPAHRIAVEWESNGRPVEGVYIPLRDTNSRLMVFGGGRIFSGVHHFASFEVVETENDYSMTMLSSNGKTEVDVSGKRTTELWPIQLLKLEDENDQCKEFCW